MPSPTNNEEKNEAAKKSSWFGSLFDNHSTDMRQEIKQHLDTYEEEKKRYEEQMERLPGLFGAAGIPFGFPPGLFGGNNNRRYENSTSGQQQHGGQQSPELEFQDLFQRLGEEMMFPGQTTSSSRIFSSGSSISMRESSRDGAQIDIQVPPETTAQDVSVDVVQEFPCVVQYQVPSSSISGKKKNAVQNQVQLQEYNDCSKLSASLSKSMLTIKAPVQEKELNQHQKPRIIPVTEHE